MPKPDVQSEDVCRGSSFILLGDFNVAAGTISLRMASRPDFGLIRIPDAIPVAGNRAESFLLLPGEYRVERADGGFRVDIRTRKRR